MWSGSIYICRGEPIGIAGFSSPTARRFGWRRLFAGLILLVLSDIFTPTEAQYANGYSYRLEVDFVDAQVSGGPHTNFPVLIDTTELDLRTVANGGKVEDANGYDIIFTSDLAGATQLAHQIESYNAVTGRIVFWVRIESLLATSKIYLFFSNSAIATFQGDVTSNGATGVWDNDYHAVWHLNDATDDPNPDATNNGNVGAPFGSPVASTGQIAGALDFNVPGDATRVDMAADASLDASLYANWTMSAWVSPMNYGNGTRWPTAYGYDAEATLGLTVDEAADPPFEGSIEHWQNDNTILWSDNAVNFGVWNHIVIVRDPVTTYFYLNGAADGFGDSVPITEAGKIPAIGSTAPYPVEDDFLGLIDEVRFSDVSRGAQWLQTGYNNQWSPATFYAIGTTISLVKRAFLADGTPVSDGNTAPTGTVVKFLIYLNNIGGVQSDLSARDVLDALFAHQAATLKVNNTTAACAVDVCTALEEGTIFTDVNATSAKTDAVDGDEVSITGSTVDAGNENVANAAVNAAANRVWAMLVQVTIQ